MRGHNSLTFASWIDSLRKQRPSAMSSSVAMSGTLQPIQEESRQVEPNDLNQYPHLGLRLRYIPPITHNGMSIQCIEKADIQSEVEYWRNSIICFVLGSNPPFPVMEGFLRRIWGRKGLDKVVGKPDGVYLVLFSLGVGAGRCVESKIFNVR